MKRWIALCILALLIFTGCSNTLALTYPEVNQLDDGPPYQSWEGIDNPSWPPSELQAEVAELAREYRATEHSVCWDMAVGLWQTLDDNGISSILAVSKTETESWGIKSLILSHVWLVVLGNDSLIIPIEYAIPRIPGDSRYEVLTTGYFYRNPTDLAAAYPLLFLPQ